MNANQIVSKLQAKGYTEQQIVHSLARSVAHQDKLLELGLVTKTVRNHWNKALNDAKSDLTNAYAERFIPCNSECMDAHEDHCVCLCGGVNHGVNLKAHVA